MDILAALHDANPQRGNKRCKVQRHLDDIPEDTANKAELVAAVAAGASDWPAQSLTLTFSALGIPVGSDTINDHRAKRCRCYR